MWPMLWDKCHVLGDTPQSLHQMNLRSKLIASHPSTNAVLLHLIADEFAEKFTSVSTASAIHSLICICDRPLTWKVVSSISKFQVCPGVQGAYCLLRACLACWVKVNADYKMVWCHILKCNVGGFCIPSVTIIDDDVGNLRILAAYKRLSVALQH